MKPNQNQNQYCPEKSIVQYNLMRESQGVVAYVLVYEVLVSEFELQWRDYVHFYTNILGKVMNRLILPSKRRNKSKRQICT